MPVETILGILSPLADDDQNVGSIFFWSFVLIFIVIGGAVIVMRAKRWLQEPDEAGSGGFGLSELRQLHKNGKMTTDEFERAKAAIVASTLAAQRRAEEAATKRAAGKASPGPKPRNR